MTQAAARVPSKPVLRSRSGLLAALRPHQWAKNLLVFAACFFSHAWHSIAPWLAALEAFAALSLCASGLYLLNDILDVESDRLHPRKRLRPYASGAFGARHGIALGCLLFGMAGALAAWMQPQFEAFLASYFGLGLLYVLIARRVAILDVVLLALLYTVRILAGGAATGIPITPWLLGFSMFLFFSIALSKRCSELAACGGSAPGRPYTSRDRLEPSGVASSYAAIVVFALYVQSPETAVLYRHPSVLWLICPVLLYWTNRLWLLAARGEIDDDVVVFALKDKVSYATGVAALIVVAFAL